MLKESIKRLRDDLDNVAGHVDALEQAQASVDAAKAKVGDLEKETEKLVQFKARLSKEAEDLKHQLAVLRADKVKEREDRQTEIAEHRKHIADLLDQIRAKQGQHSKLSDAVEELRRKFA